MAKLDPILQKALQIQASDVHIAVNNPPLYRHLGDLKRFKANVLTASMTRALIYEILSPDQQAEFEKKLQLDFCYELKGLARFRVNIIHQRLGMDA
ncbi:MAG: type IV pili twitching motility protein PilT, partial [Desulfobacteraceae bacterium]